MVSTEPLKVLDTIQGSNFMAIQAGIQTLKRRQLKADSFTIQVIRDPMSIVVIFKAKQPGVTSSILGVRPALNLEVSPEDLRALLSDHEHVTVLDRIEGSSLPFIEAAVAIFHKHNLDLSLYQIEVIRNRDLIVVTFTDKDQSTIVLGNPGGRLGFEVVLRPKDLHVVRSHFIR